MASESKIMNMKILDKYGEGTEEDLINGMLWAKNNGANILNISAGIERNCDGTCEVCKTARLIAKEILVCASAGNNPTIGSCPAQAGKPVISCGAFTYNGKKIADYSHKATTYQVGTIRMTPLDEKKY